MERQNLKQEKLFVTSKQRSVKQLSVASLTASHRIHAKPETADGNERSNHLRRNHDYLAVRPLVESNNEAAADSTNTMKKRSFNSGNNEICNELSIMSADNVFWDSCDEAYNKLMDQLENSFSLEKRHCNRGPVEFSNDSESFFGVDRFDSKRLRLSQNSPHQKRKRVSSNSNRMSVEYVKYCDRMNVAGNNRSQQKQSDINYSSELEDKFVRLSDESVRVVADANLSHIAGNGNSVAYDSEKTYESSLLEEGTFPAGERSCHLDSRTINETEPEKITDLNVMDIENLCELMDYDWTAELTAEGDFALKSGDIISIKATRHDASMGQWCVDDDAGYIVKHPDLLVTGTSIVRSVFCQRQAVLSYLFPGVEDKNTSMLVGSLVHELLQEILKNKIYSEDGMKGAIVNLITSTKTLFLAYQFDVSLSRLEIELENFIPAICTFLNSYVLDNDALLKTWPGRIVEITSIEENFWVPSLGIKGKTDFAVKVEVNGKIRTLPLELKTGRATNSTEHRGQITLYSMMMSELGIDTDSGLLLYLRQNMLSEIKPNHAERRGLVSVRNNLVDWYTANERFSLSMTGTFSIPELPEPINHRSGCAKCPYLTICSAAALSQKQRVNLAENNPLNTLLPASTSHLSPIHIRFVFHWIGLLKFEEMEKREEWAINVSDIWYIDAATRQARGFCIDQLRIIEVQTYEGKFRHLMNRHLMDVSYDLTKSKLVEGDYIVVSSESRIAIALGFVRAISEFSICLEIDRRLETTEKAMYIVDKYSVSESLLGFNISCLLLLFENTDRAARLRRFIINGEVPSFSPVVHIMADENRVRSFLSSSKLNVFQKNAILKTITAHEYHLIKGMPGTGKTATIVALVQLLVALEYSVLVTSQTHSAVDNILLRLTNSVEVLRLGSMARVHADLKSCCEETVIAQRSIRTTDELEHFYNKPPVVGVTCMGCCHSMMKKRIFDVCIVDEATQVLLPSVIRSLYSSRKFVLVGDPNQLPPIVHGREASHLGLGESLFKKLDKPEVTSTLCLQYRMNADIAKLANMFAYDNLLQCDCEDVSSATINVRLSPQIMNQHVWLEPVLSPDLNQSVVFLNTSHLKRLEATCEYSNTLEADIVNVIIRSLAPAREYDVGIIAPFKEQVKLLRNMAKEENIDVEINTVDQYQGRDKDVIIYSCTKHTCHKGEGILADKRRLTVAITRAKRKLVIVGNTTILKTYSVFRQLLEIVPAQNVIDIESL